MAFVCRALLIATSSCLLLLLGAGCTTTAAKKALNDPTPKDRYSGFDQETKTKSERRHKKPDPVSDDVDPEKAVDILIGHMQSQQHNYRIPAEGQLRYWAAKQGVAEMVVQRIRALGLTKQSRPLEVRAPALRLLRDYGKEDSIADLIEVLADDDYGMRSTVFKVLRAHSATGGQDFGFNPAGGVLSRVEAIDRWRRWWQDRQRGRLTQTNPVPTIERTKPPEIVEPAKPEGALDERRHAGPPAETVLPPPRDEQR